MRKACCRAGIDAATCWIKSIDMDSFVIFVAVYLLTNSLRVAVTE